MSQAIVKTARKRPLLAAFCSILAVVLGYLLLWPVPFDPVVGPVRAANPAGTGVFVKNNRLAEARLLKTGEGPEGIALDRQGRIYTGLTNGDILRGDGDGNFEVIANTGGRPLGLEFDAAGNLVIADAFKGLLSMTPEGAINVLATHFDGARMIFVDDLAIADDGKIYFSDASRRYEYGHDIAEVFELRPTGRLIVFDPQTGDMELLLDNLYFANGVAVSRAGDFVVVNETHNHRIMRYWLAGPKRGTADVFSDNLPAFLDNITRAPDGGYWVAGVAPRTDDLDALVARPFLRKVLWRLMSLGLVDPVQLHSYAIKLNARGVPIVSLEDDSHHIFMMTSVIEQNGQLYLGSLINDAIGVIDAQ
ncbi:MAG: SMP-30/gluconolactonase/LRE family protein [Alphaproteobacteria bacterium]|nr:SMP-30/gluconolactonase/LRE family protein [Alphaproteobacteria bacterium]